MAVGVRADTGASYTKDAMKAYLFGIGGEVQFDAGGRVASVGVGCNFFKLNFRNVVPVGEEMSDDDEAGLGEAWLYYRPRSRAMLQAAPAALMNGQVRVRDI